MGIITTLSKELKAVIAVLDQRHGQPSNFQKPKSDTNNYVWGQIGEHSIVLVSHPMKMTGKVSAATTALSMLRTIPSIRFCLIVGIGGGVPYPEKAPDEQVRLGDVVVSAPSGTTGGVVQYDLGKVEIRKGGSYFRRTGQLNNPSRELLSVLTTFDAEMNGSRLQRSIGSTAAKMDIGTKEFSAYPGAVHDRLFPASYTHRTSFPWYSRFRFWPNGANSQREVGSAHCLHCDPRKTVKRFDRDSPSIPRIHYGLIASGDREIKDARIRDEIVNQIQQENVGECLCFDMDAAGIMNIFPSLVVRGISCYADSHENGKWQSYAAIAAATVAKELLSFVPISEIESEQSTSGAVPEKLQG